jgi:hypothetical protein
MRTFGRYLGELLSSAWGILFVIAGAISTGVTFVLIYKPTFALPHWIPAGISILAWVLAPYQIYRRQQTQIQTLTANQRRPRRSELMILPEPESYYIRRATDGSRRDEAIYLELCVSIENKGERPATVTAYSLRIENVGEFPNIRPEPQTWIWGLRAQHALGNPGPETVRSYIEVPGERVAARRKLPFTLNSPAPADARQIRCELTVQDTEGTPRVLGLQPLRRVTNKARWNVTAGRVGSATRAP